MKQLLRKPFLLALMLSLPLWIAFNNYIVALCLALLVAFLLSMLESIVTIGRQRRQTQHHAPPKDRPDPPPSDPHS